MGRLQKCPVKLFLFRPLWSRISLVIKGASPFYRPIERNTKKPRRKTGQDQVKIFTEESGRLFHALQNIAQETIRNVADVSFVVDVYQLQLVLYNTHTNNHTRLMVRAKR